LFPNSFSLQKLLLMKIAVVARELLKSEMQSKPVGSSVDFIWVEKPEQLHGIDADVFFDLEFEAGEQRINLLEQLLPKPVFINSVVETLSTINPSFIRINAWPGFLERKVCETAVSTKQSETGARAVFETMEWDCSFVPDTTGMISPRIIAMIINEAYHTFEAGVGTKAAIDMAMKLGTNYPYGPFEWSGRVGIKNIFALLSALAKNDPAYVISQALIDEAGI
jgi:3-hydroxybutyryl-CoA dehydrogenase